MHILVARTERHQPAGLDQFMVRIDIRQALPGRKIHHAGAVMQKDAVRQDEQRLRPLLEDGSEGGVEVFRVHARRAAAA